MSHTKIIPGTDVLDFFCDNGGEVSFGREYFARHSEHVKLFTGWQGDACVETRYGGKFTVDSRCTVIVSPASADDSLHPWERDLVTNGAPFARPSNRVRS